MGYPTLFLFCQFDNCTGIEHKVLFECLHSNVLVRSVHMIVFIRKLCAEGNSALSVVDIGYAALAYAVAFVVDQLGSMFSGNGNIVGFILAIAVIGVFGWALFRRPRKA